MEINFMLWPQILITVILTALIVWGALWVEKNKKKHPTVYRNRNTVRAIVWLILNIGQF